MPQTMLGLLALVLASLVSYNQQRNSVSNYQSMIQNEVEMAATGTMTHVLELIGSRSFDESSTPDGIHASQQVPELDEHFTAGSRFGGHDRGQNGCDLMEPFRTPECDDVDDVDGIRNQSVVTQISDGRTIALNVDLDVDYVNDDSTHSISTRRTRHKLVTLTAESPLLRYGGITIERVFSYDPIKDEAEFEQVHGPLGTSDPDGDGGCGGGGGEIGGC